VDFQDEDAASEVIIVVDGEETVEESLRIDFGDSVYSTRGAHVISIHAVGTPLSLP
jgi:hypothetical protein